MFCSSSPSPSPSLSPSPSSPCRCRCRCGCRCRCCGCCGCCGCCCGCGCGGGGGAGEGKQNFIQILSLSQRPSSHHNLLSKALVTARFPLPHPRYAARSWCSSPFVSAATPPWFDVSHTVQEQVGCFTWSSSSLLEYSVLITCWLVGGLGWSFGIDYLGVLSLLEFQTNGPKPSNSPRGAAEIFSMLPKGGIAMGCQSRNCHDYWLPDPLHVSIFQGRSHVLKPIWKGARSLSRFIPTMKSFVAEFYSVSVLNSGLYELPDWSWFLKLPFIDCHILSDTFMSCCFQRNSHLIDSGVHIIHRKFQQTIVCLVVTGLANWRTHRRSLTLPKMERWWN